MIILRKSKLFANPVASNTATVPQEQQQQPSPAEAMKSSNELLVEQMRLQRAMMMVQKQRQQVRSQEARDRLRVVNNAQRIEERKDEEQAKNALRIKKIENDREDQAKNVGLYKTRSHATPPVSMKV